MLAGYHATAPLPPRSFPDFGEGLRQKGMEGDPWPQRCSLSRNGQLPWAEPLGLFQHGVGEGVMMGICP